MQMQNIKIILIITFIMIVALYGNAFCSKVAVVYDGDTFELENGERVRLLGIDAPESYQPGGDIAGDFLEKLVLGKEVRLEKDKSDKDAYGRLLRYVYVKNLFVNAEIIRKGYAEVRFLLPDTLHKKEFEKLQKTAFRNKKGLWAFSGLQAPIIESTKVKKTKSKIASHKMGVISWKDASKYYGQIKTVEGFVIVTHNSGKCCFLNFHQDWKHNFTAVIFSGNFDKFPPHPEDYYLNKKVQITGLIKEYKEKPEIILKSPSQIKIVK